MSSCAKRFRVEPASIATMDYAWWPSGAHIVKKRFWLAGCSTWQGKMPVTGFSS